jgi:hypothetical protein
MSSSSFQTTAGPELHSDDTLYNQADIENLWLEWQVVPAEQELISFDFNLVTKSSPEPVKVSVPLKALLHLAEKYSWLQLLRGPEHIPQDPYELVRFIKTLENH